MPEPFSVLTTPAFERDFRKVSKGNPILINALEELIAKLQEDPYNHTGRHKIKKLAGVKPGDGQ
jgi:mRNA-degrading endonuclease YafQ of YafQ-DinJ toxin-antitoxin module